MAPLVEGSTAHYGDAYEAYDDGDYDVDYDADMAHADVGGGGGDDDGDGDFQLSPGKTAASAAPGAPSATAGSKRSRSAAAAAAAAGEHDSDDSDDGQGRAGGRNAVRARTQVQPRTTRQHTTGRGVNQRTSTVTLGFKGTTAASALVATLRRKKVYVGEKDASYGRTIVGRRLGLVRAADPADQGYNSTLCVFPQPKLPLRQIDPNAAIALITKPFKVPSLKPNIKLTGGGIRSGTTLGVRRRAVINLDPMHDPEAPDAVILYEPKVVLTEFEKLELLKSTTIGKKPNLGEVHVVVDPILGRVLRPHQIEGLRFLYNCTTGLTAENAFGCIMADEMGLGKTLQCIALLWTHLRQSPTPGKPCIEKAIIACPSSLVKNWANELVKWLGPGRIRPYACDGKASKEQTIKDIELFVSAKGRGIVYPVLIVSYETLRIYSPQLCKTEIGMLLCDEGHRLKNADSNTYMSLNLLKAKRRVILSGTPIQNDLTEYFSLLDFAIPGVLGTEAEFRKKFELPILRGRDADASEKDRQTSEERLRELLTVANKFIIRRTAELLTKYLPVKYEYVVFCKLSEMQANIYRHLSSHEMARLATAKEKKTNKNGGTSSLKIITTLKKLVNHPSLIDKDDIPPQFLPPDFNFKDCQPQYSGKMYMLYLMLNQMKNEGNDKIVLISNYTQTLDGIEKMCNNKKWRLCRLDGSMTISNRQKLVDRFNDPTTPEFIFLLSSKAGGCGINLIGANRLILMDPDWNPANDAQALARVWRDGQKKMCFIYRFIATGTIEEKIFQRQAHKQSLSSCVVDEEQDVERHFSLEALRQLFAYNEQTMSDTHDTFKCKRCVKGRQMIKQVEGTINTGATAADTSTWNHFSGLEIGKIYDHLLREQAKATGIVTYAFQNKSHDKQEAKAVKVVEEVVEEKSDKGGDRCDEE